MWPQDATTSLGCSRCQLAAAAALEKVGDLLPHSCASSAGKDGQPSIKLHLIPHGIARLASAGMCWVDMLLILSARLGSAPAAAAPVDPGSGAPSCAAVVAAYWRRRAVRLLPGYMLANPLVLLALGPAEGISEQAAAACWINFTWCPCALWATPDTSCIFTFKDATH